MAIPGLEAGGLLLAPLSFALRPVTPLCPLPRSVLGLQPAGAAERLDPAEGAAAQPARGKAGERGRRNRGVGFSPEQVLCSQGVPTETPRALPRTAVAARYTEARGNR